jgi:hypothetical protein
MSRVRVTIDKLILKGIDRADGKALTEALRWELSQALADPTNRIGWTESTQTPVLKLGRLSLESGTAGARKFGGGLGRAIGRGIGR